MDLEINDVWSVKEKYGLTLNPRETEEFYRILLLTRDVWADALNLDLPERRPSPEAVAEQTRRLIKFLGEEGYQAYLKHQIEWEKKFQ